MKQGLNKKRSPYLSKSEILVPEKLQFEEWWKNKFGIWKRQRKFLWKLVMGFDASGEWQSTMEVYRGSF
ncbi:hypothetical protein P8452_77560 [Trifolium repens]|nr:hypothetical protein P8452_35364 [Trifolium repens]WJX62122.1 hypothetical protein P8452_47151 [Trifolium repens]WJX96340.1 hypothetical protein P8452_77559 [Trifolium repens]WJX96341.1 hypothetical protein P8452_77560 [Trifolium repens]